MTDSSNFNLDNKLDLANNLVNNLYDYRDNYFINNGLKTGSLKDNDISIKLNEVLIELEKIREDCESQDKAQYLMLFGKALNVENKFNEKGFELLSKSVKLNPKLIEGWNQLGEAYWKKGEIKSAINCFEGALKQNENDKNALRNLSMLLRQVGDSPKERYENILKSLSKAKKALDVDIEDGVNWCTLGNAYFYLHFFSPSNDVTKLNQCKFAYNKAMKDLKAQQKPDFLYNYAILMEYEENYQNAVDFLDRASRLDPNWTDPAERKDLLINYLKIVKEMIKKKGSLKNKRINAILLSLKSDAHLIMCKDKSKLFTFNDLNEGINCDKMFLGKVIGSVTNEKLLASCVCLIDSNQDSIALSIYNLNHLKEPKIGDTIVLKDPLFKYISVNYKNLRVTLPFIRIDNPLSITINGKVLTDDYLTRPKVDFILNHD